MAFQPSAFQAGAFQIAVVAFTIATPQTAGRPTHDAVAVGQKHTFTIAAQSVGSPSHGAIAIDGGSLPGNIGMANQDAPRPSATPVNLGQKHVLSISTPQWSGAPTHTTVSAFPATAFVIEGPFQIDPKQDHPIYLGGEQNLFIAEQVIRPVHGEIRVAQPRPPVELPPTPVAQGQLLGDDPRQRVAWRDPEGYGREYGLSEDRVMAVIEKARARR